MRCIGTDASDDHRPELDPSVYHAMELSHSPPLMDHLQELGALVTLTLFLGPRLKGISLKLDLSKPIFATVSVLESLKVCTLSLEYLVVSGPAQLSTVICETACSLQYLQVLRVQNMSLSSEQIHHLSLFNLIELKMEITEDVVMHRPSADNQAKSFLTLCVLCIQIREWVIAEAFFETYLQPSILEKVEIDISERPLSDDIHRLLTTMHQCCTLSFLISITITSSFFILSMTSSIPQYSIFYLCSPIWSMWTFHYPFHSRKLMICSSTPWHWHGHG
jgi:hypothetical protein